MDILLNISIVLIIAAALFFAVRSMIKKKKKGGCSACCGNCSRCRESVQNPTGTGHPENE